MLQIHLQVFFERDRGLWKCRNEVATFPRPCLYSIGANLVQLQGERRGPIRSNTWTAPFTSASTATAARNSAAGQACATTMQVWTSLSRIVQAIRRFVAVSCNGHKNIQDIQARDIHRGKFKQASWIIQTFPRQRFEAVE
jgi:hypothetical protein